MLSNTGGALWVVAGLVLPGVAVGEDVLDHEAPFLHNLDLGHHLVTQPRESSLNLPHSPDKDTISGPGDEKRSYRCIGILG